MLKTSDQAHSEVALLLIDVINPFDFEDARQLLRWARPVARCIAALKSGAAARGIPIIYVNDNFGRWRSDFRAVYRYCRRASSPGAGISRLLKPDRDDYFVLKPKHSGFYCTSLEVLLRHLGVRKLILSGFAGKYVRALHGERRVPSRLRIDHPARLSGLELKTIERRRNHSHAPVSSRGGASLLRAGDPGLNSISIRRSGVPPLSRSRRSARVALPDESPAPGRKRSDLRPCRSRA